MKRLIDWCITTTELPADGAPLRARDLPTVIVAYCGLVLVFGVAAWVLTTAMQVVWAIITRR